jgi:hypothetical protein
MYLTPNNPAGPDPRGNVFAMPTPAQHPGCNCGCHKQAMGGLTFNGTGLFGTGLFASGLDLSQWTWAEWAAVALGGYVLYSVFHTTAAGARKARRGYRYVSEAGKRRRRAQADKLRARAKLLEQEA